MAVVVVVGVVVEVGVSDFNAIILMYVFGVVDYWTYRYLVIDVSIRDPETNSDHSPQSFFCRRPTLPPHTTHYTCISEALHQTDSNHHEVSFSWKQTHRQAAEVSRPSNKLSPSTKEFVCLSATPLSHNHCRWESLFTLRVCFAETNPIMDMRVGFGRLFSQPKTIGGNTKFVCFFQTPSPGPAWRVRFAFVSGFVSIEFTSRNKPSLFIRGFVSGEFRQRKHVVTNQSLFVFPPPGRRAGQDSE